MLTPKIPALLCCFFSASMMAQAQGTFQNLGFESANVPTLPPDQTAYVPFTNALPYWAGAIGTNLPSMSGSVLYNGGSIGSALISLISRGTAFYSNDVIAGTYTVGLFAGTY